MTFYNHVDKAIKHANQQHKKCVVVRVDDSYIVVNADNSRAWSNPRVEIVHITKG